MMDPWLPVLEKLPLSRTERAVVQRYEADPQGRTFLPVAEILRSHKKIDEGLELLTHGVERHPTFTVARVVLTRELFQKGMVAQAWQVLEASPVALGDNILAQKLRIRLAVLLGLAEEAQTTFKHMQANRLSDADINALMRNLEVSGLDVAKAQIIAEMRGRGVELNIPQQPQSVIVKKSPSLPMPPLPAEAKDRMDTSDLDSGKIAAANFAVQGFHVVPLNEVFQPGDQAAMAGTLGLNGLELDSTTLGEIYAKQGHFSKALEIYKRLLRLSPNNEGIKRRVSDLSKQEREQRDQDISLDPGVVDAMETVELLDTQIRFFNKLLDRLGP